MKCSCSSNVNKRPSCLSYFSSFFSFTGFPLVWFEAYRLFCCWVFWWRCWFFLESLHEFGLWLYVRRLCNGFVCWRCWYYHSFDWFWRDKNYLFRGHQCQMAALLGWWRHQVRSLSCQPSKKTVWIGSGHFWCHFFSYGVPHFCLTLSTAHCFWILELALYCCYHSKLTEEGSLYSCHAWVLASSNDFVRARVGG